jgi:hypothetical protein
MKPQILCATLFLTACTTAVQVRGPYAAALGSTDIRQIRRIAQELPHVGHTLFIVDTVQRDHVRVRTREFQGPGWAGSDMYVIRRGGHWQFDEHSPFSQQVGSTTASSFY